jgi:hypothetical protein
MEDDTDDNATENTDDNATDDTKDNVNENMEDDTKDNTEDNLEDNTADDMKDNTVRMEMMNMTKIMKMMTKVLRMIYANDNSVENQLHQPVNTSSINQKSKMRNKSLYKKQSCYCI